MHVGLGVRVHKHLLCDISKEMREAVADYEKEMRAFASKPKSETVVEDQPSVLAGWFLHKRPLEMWSGFLYGLPLWSCDDETSVNDDFRVLVEVYTFAKEYKHSNAQDASIDAMRDIICNHSKNITAPLTSIFVRGCLCADLPAKMLMEQMVWGKCVGQAREWVTTYTREKPKLEVPDDLEHEMCNMYLVKGEKDSTGDRPPDLMARCRYHSYAGDQPCYLDK